MFDFLLGTDLISTVVNIVGFIATIEFIGTVFLLIGGIRK